MIKRHSFYLSFILIIAFITNSCKEVKERPNIVFAIMDDASYSHFGAYGCEWINTPNFDRIAQDGILFSRAYTPNAKCGPSRSAIITGRNSWQLEEAANHWCNFPEKFKSVFEVFGDHGYHVGFTGKGWAPGDPGQLNGKPRLLTGKAYNSKIKESPTSGISPINYAANFSDFLDERVKEDPFLFWFGAKEPHRVYEYGSGQTKGGKKLSQIEEVYKFWPDNDSVRNDLLDYAYEIEYFDIQLGKILDELKKRGELDNTLIVVTSDNGMPFPRIKGQEYELSNHMPLVMMWPSGIKSPGRKVNDLVSFIDLAPTFLELAKIEEAKSGMQDIEGNSLVDKLLSEKNSEIDSTDQYVLFGKERHDVGRPDDVGYPIRGIVQGDFLFIQNFETSRWPAGNPETGYLNCDGGPTKTVCLNARKNEETFKYWEWSFGKRPEFELYNIKEDPICLNNLAEEKEYQNLFNSMRDKMIVKLREQNDPRILGKGYVFDKYPYANPQGVSFYKRYMEGEKLDYSWVNESDFRPLN